MSAKDIDPQLQKLDDELAGWKEPAQHLARGARIPRYAINLSSSTLDDRAFPKAVAAELIASGVPGTSLLFEISEDDAMSRLESVLRSRPASALWAAASWCRASDGAARRSFH